MNTDWLAIIAEENRRNRERLLRMEAEYERALKEGGLLSKGEQYAKEQGPYDPRTDT